MYTGLAYILPIILTFSFVGVGHTTSQVFYKDKLLRIVVGSSPGGMLDTYTRLIARHIDKHIPGHPTIVIENKPGAGTLIAANYVYQVAKPDGLTMGTFIGNLVIAQVLGEKGVQFDARRFKWIGIAAKGHAVCILTRASGITSLRDWKESGRPIKLGGTGRGANTDDIAKILKKTLGLPIQLVSGYGGSGPIRVAAERGELDGLCANWEILKVTWRKALESGDVNVVLQVMPKPHADLPTVPLAIDNVGTEKAQKLLRAGVHDPTVFIQPFVAPPDTPDVRVEILREAFMNTMKDGEFLADAKKAQLAIDPIPGEQVEQIIAGLFQLDSELVNNLKEVLK